MTPKKCQTCCGGGRLVPARLRVHDDCRIPVGIALRIDYGLGPGSGIELPATLCLDCGTVQGDWPAPLGLDKTT